MPSTPLTDRAHTVQQQAKIQEKVAFARTHKAQAATNTIANSLHVTQAATPTLRFLQSRMAVPHPHLVCRASHTPTAANAIPASAQPVSVSPNMAQAISAVVGGVR